MSDDTPPEKSPAFVQAQLELQAALQGLDDANRKMHALVPDMEPGEAPQLMFDLQHQVVMRVVAMLVPELNHASRIAQAFIAELAHGAMGRAARKPPRPRRQ